MLSRFIFKPSHLRFLNLLSSKTHLSQSNPISKQPPLHLPNIRFFPKVPQFYSTSNGNNRDPPDLWNLSSNTDPTVDSLFSEETSLPNRRAEEIKAEEVASWVGRGEGDKGDDIFKRQENQTGGVGGPSEWDTENDIKSWDFSVGLDEEGKVAEELFKNVELKGADGVEIDMVQESDQDNKRLEAEQKGLTAVLKVFGFFIVFNTLESTPETISVQRSMSLLWLQVQTVLLVT